ncbi:hypothetical protein GCM10028801_35930 [Nocardioides maradonensis]
MNRRLVTGLCVVPFGLPLLTGCGGTSGASVDQPSLATIATTSASSSPTPSATHVPASHTAKPKPKPSPTGPINAAPYGAIDRQAFMRFVSIIRNAASGAPNSFPPEDTTFDSLVGTAGFICNWVSNGGSPEGMLNSSGYDLYASHMYVAAAKASHICS